MTLGQRISGYRKALGVSQEELGARLGVSRQAVSKWETGGSLR
ncbi:helix-turn-helix transcriptional regulator [Dysosmobacter sp.]